MPDFESTLVRSGLYAITQGHVRCFLAVGEREALLVDTGLGGGDLRAFVETITALPVTVVFTHADSDHVGHAAQFDRRLMHPAEFDYCRQKTGKLIPMTPIWEGDTLSASPYRFEVILIPGHTPGSIALLEREQRFLIGGDSIQRGIIFMFGNGRSFYAYRASMQKLAARLGSFDAVYASHGPLTVTPDTISQLDAAAARLMAGQATGQANGRGFDESVKRFEIDGLAFYAVEPEPTQARSGGTLEPHSGHGS